MLAASILALSLASAISTAPQDKPATPPAAAKAPAPATPPTIDELQQRVAQLFQGLQEKYGQIENPSEEEMKKIQEDVATQADAALEGIDLAALTPEQMQVLEPVIGMSRKGREKMVNMLANRRRTPP